MFNFVKCWLRHHKWKEYLGMDFGNNTIAYSITKRCLRCDKIIISEYGEV